MPRMPYTPPAAATAQAFSVPFRTSTGISDAIFSDHLAVLLADGVFAGAYAGARLPFTPSAIYAVYRPNAAGDIYRTVTAAWGAEGEATNANTDSIAYGTYTVGSQIVVVENITAAFTGIASGDVFACQYRRDGTNIADTINAEVFAMHLWIVP